MATYYISTKNGSDCHAGTSPDAPLRTLAAASRLPLGPGDALLLEAGSVFEDEALHLSVQGSKDAPIRVAAYGEGERPVIAAKGNGLWYQDYRAPLDAPTHVYHGYVSSAVLLADCEYITLEGLEISNDPGTLFGETYRQADKMNRTGVSVIAQDRGTLHNICIKDLYIHDVKGNVYDKHMNNGGIYCSALTPHEAGAPIARYDGLTIEGCTVRRCSRWGIAAGYSYTHQQFLGVCLDDEIVKTYGHEHVILAHNFVDEVGGDGITPMYCYRPVIEYNVARNNAMEINDTWYTEPLDRQGKTAAAIWPWKCKDALFQYNEVYFTLDNQDGQAWDADSGDGTVYRYNYSYGNGGGCVMFCLQESVNNLFQYNISVMDRGGIINPVQNPDARISENIFVLPEGVPFIRDNMSGGHMNVENNLIVRLGKPAEGDWHHQTEFARYHGNLYQGFSDLPEEDDAAVRLTGEEAWLSGLLTGPSETDGHVHGGEAFEGYREAMDELRRRQNA